MGEHTILNRWLTLVALIALWIASLACSSGDDFIAGSQIPRNDVLNDPLPASLDDQFKTVGGGELIVLNTYDDNYIDIDGTETSTTESLFTRLSGYSLSDDQLAALDPSNPNHARLIDFSNQELNDGENDRVNIDTFLMMKTEVTVGMFVDFLNSIAFKADELSNAGEGETTTFTEAENIYKPIMQSESSCGIYRFEFGARVNDEITNFSGFYIETSQKTSNDDFIDPYIQIQKPRFASQNQSSSFEVAPGRRDYPMVYVTQDESKEFCRWLGSQYRLPTWQEWSWAAQSGNVGYQFGTSDGNLFTNGKLAANFQYKYDTTGTTREVGTTGSANRYGLFDLAGNVYEWTYFKAEDQATGATIPYVDRKFLMGGSFKSQDPAYLSTWLRRGGAHYNVWADDLGFRVIFDRTRGNSIADAE